MESESEVTQSCPTLYNPMDCSLPRSSLHGILQARVLEWVAISFSRGSSQPRDQTLLSCIPGRHFNLWATREAPWNRTLSLKGKQSSIFIGMTDSEAEAAILWPLDVKSLLIGKDPDAGKDWSQEEKGTTGNEMVGNWDGWLNGHEFEQALGDGEGQRSLVGWSPWGCKESDMTKQPNWTDTYYLW